MSQREAAKEAIRKRSAGKTGTFIQKQENWGVKKLRYLKRAICEKI